MKDDANFWLYEGGHHVAVMFGDKTLFQYHTSMIEKSNDEQRLKMRQIVSDLRNIVGARRIYCNGTRA